MGYTRLGDAADTATARALHQAALAVIAARNSGNAAALAAAQKAFNATAGTNAQRIKALSAVDAAPSGALDRLQAILTGAGKTAALVLAAILGAPFILRALSRSGARSLNPGRRRRSGRRRGR